MPWAKRECFPRVRVATKLPVVLSPDEVELFFRHVGCLKHRAALMCLATEPVLQALR